MATKATDPDQVLIAMETPIRVILGAQHTLSSMTFDREVTSESVAFVSDALWPSVKQLDELWKGWAKHHDSAKPKEG